MISWVHDTWEDRFANVSIMFVTGSACHRGQYSFEFSNLQISWKSRFRVIKIMNISWILLYFIILHIKKDYIGLCNSFIFADTRFPFHCVDHSTRILVLIHYIYLLAVCYLTSCLRLQTDFSRVVFRSLA